jgi:serine/threonine protein kinase
MSSSLGPHCPYCGQANRPSAKFCNRCGKPLQAGQTFVYVPLQAGQLMHGGAYRIVKPLSKGGMGALYLAAQTLAGKERPCVIKGMLDYVDPTDPAAVRKAQQRFQEEAATLVELNHVGIPQIYDYFAEGGRNYIVMAYIDGENLQERLERSGPQKSEEIARYGVQLCKILEYLASLTPPVVHHDIKPANIIIDKNTGTVRLVDFGTAKARLTLEPGGKVGLQKSSIYGTAGYAPPEQYEGQSTPKSDVYALAATMYHLLTDDDPGDHPFSFPRLSQMESILGQALEPDPNRRISATELREALEKWLQSPHKPKPKLQTNNFRVVLPAVPDGKVPETVQALVRVLKVSEQQATVWACAAPQVVLKTTSRAETSRVVAQLKAAGIAVKMTTVNESRLQLPIHMKRDLMDKGYTSSLVITRLGPDKRCHCYACGYEWTSRKPAGGPPPSICPKCKAKDWSRHRLFKCRVCDHEFAHGNQTRPPQQLFPACPACGTTNWLPGRAPVLELKSEKTINLGTLLLCQSTSITINVSHADGGSLRRIVSKLMLAPSSSINISNAGGGNLRGIIRCRESWLRIEQPFKGSGKFTIPVDPHQLKGEKSYRGVIEVISNGGTAKVKVELFAQTPEPEDLVSLSDKHWSRARSYLYAGEFAEWFEALNRSDLANEVEAICQRGGDQDVGLEEFLHVLAPKLPAPILRFSTKALDFGAIDPGQQKAVSLKLENAGRGCLLVTLQSRQSWLRPRPDTVKMLSGQSQLVVVELHGEDLSARPRIRGQIDVRDQFNRLEHLEVQATIPLAFRSGEVARTPAELARLCDKYWVEAREYLYDGTFEQGFRVLNRGDMAAEAETVRQRGGDQDVGLEGFLHSLVPKLPLPNWQASPAVLDFGVLTVGSKSLSLTLENSGRGCALVAAQFPRDAFKVEPVAVKLLAGQSQTLEVELDVSQLMARTGMVPKLEFKDQFDRLQHVQIKVRLGLTLGSDSVALEPEDLPALCDQHWIEIRRCFQDGSLVRWLEATGHQDLARVALAHQQDADPDRHLDQFLRAIDPTRAPRLVSNVTELDFGTLPQGQRGTQVVEISNSGKGLLDVRVDCTPADTWLSVKSTTFRCFSGQKQQIEVTVDTTRLTREQAHQAQLTIASNGGTLSVPVKVTVPAKPPTPMIDPPHLNFGAVALGKDIAPQALNITNAGDGSLAVAVKTDQDWIQVTPEWFRGISGDAVEQIQVSVDATRLKSRTSYSGYVVVASRGAEMWVPVYVRTLPTRWQVFTDRVRTTIRYAFLGLLIGLLASLTAWAWGKGLTLFLQQEGTGNILRDLVVASAFVCALIVSGFAALTKETLGTICLAGVLGAGLGIIVILIGLIAGQLPLTEFIIEGVILGLLAGVAKGLTRKL